MAPYIVADAGPNIRFGKSEYGFQWWVLRDIIMNRSTQIAACIGNGGRRIIIDQSNKQVVVFTGGNYRMADRYLQPYKILQKYTYPLY